MAEPTIVLWDVVEPLASALRAAAADWDRTATSTSGAIAFARWAPRVRLVVAGGCSADSLRERMLAAQKQFPRALAVGLVPRSDLGAGARISDLRRVAIEDEARSVADLAGDLVEAACTGAGRWVAELGGVSLATALLQSRLAAAAAHDATVLLQGETGTGKTVAAKAIHDGSRRARAPFVHLDCAALAPNLMESELFGHERGSFTGAERLRAGRFELAGEGTLFLDEIGDVPAALQVKFLRVLEERRWERVGGSDPLSMRARVVAATHVDLARAVQEERFRRDLYYRLRRLVIRIAPLRERPADVPALVAKMLPALCEPMGRPVPRLSKSFMQRLESHTWPGNVRELRNALEAALLRRPAGTLRASALDAILEEGAREHEDATPDAERERLSEALLVTGGNVARAGRLLGLPRSTLRYRIARLGLSKLTSRD